MVGARAACRGGRARRPDPNPDPNPNRALTPTLTPTLTLLTPTLTQTQIINPNPNPNLNQVERGAAQVTEQFVAYLRSNSPGSEAGGGHGGGRGGGRGSGVGGRGGKGRGEGRGAAAGSAADGSLPRRLAAEPIPDELRKRWSRLRLRHSTREPPDAKLDVFKGRAPIKDGVKELRLTTKLGGLLQRAFRDGGARLEPGLAKELAKVLSKMGSLRRLADYIASAAGSAAGGTAGAAAGGEVGPLAAAAVVAFRRSVARVVTARLSFDAKVHSVTHTPARIRPQLCTADGAYTWSWY